MKVFLKLAVLNQEAGTGCSCETQQARSFQPLQEVDTRTPASRHRQAKVLAFSVCKPLIGQSRLCVALPESS
jgi:hypothetical protein